MQSDYITQHIIFGNGDVHCFKPSIMNGLVRIIMGLAEWRVSCERTRGSFFPRKRKEFPIPEVRAPDGCRMLETKDALFRSWLVSFGAYLGHRLRLSFGRSLPRNHGDAAFVIATSGMQGVPRKSPDNARTVWSRQITRFSYASVGRRLQAVA